MPRPARYVHAPTPLLRITSVILAAALSVQSSGCAILNPRPSLPSPADSALARGVLQLVLTDYWRDALERRADLALRNGVRITTLPIVSQQNRKADLRVAQRVGHGLDMLDVSALAQDDYLTTLALRWEVEARAERSAFYYVDFSLLSPTTTPLRTLTETYRLHPLTSPADAERYLFFAEGFPFVVEQIRGGLEERRARGYAAPREMVESALAFFRGLRALENEGPWGVDSARLAGLDSVTSAALRREIALAVSLRIAPSLDSIINYLESDYLPIASTRPGLWQYPGGKELYRHLLRRHSSLDVPPEEAHRVGLGELRRIDSTMTEVRRRQGWNPDARAFHDSLRLAIGVAPSIDAMIVAVGAREQVLVERLPGQFARFPALAPVVRATTPAEALLWPDGTYLLPVAGIDSLGQLLLTERWRQPAVRASIASTTYRLLLPGRHLEAALVGGDPTIQAMRRQMETAGFSDGWAQYAASLAGEMGMYTDPLDAYGRLLDEGTAMALLVVDTGIHYLGWSMLQGREVLGRYRLAPDADVDRMIVERIINDPGRAGAGALGAREVAAMRAWMRGELDAAFDLRAWHNEMLSLGSLPLPIVGSHLEWWLYARERRAAAENAAAAKAAAAKAAAAKAAAAKAAAAKGVPKKPRP